MHGAKLSKVFDMLCVCGEIVQICPKLLFFVVFLFANAVLIVKHAHIEYVIQALI